MGWQAEVFARLRDREWHFVGELFEAIELQIPLHYAMRHAMQPNYGRSEMPVISAARWQYFSSTLSIIGIENEGEHVPRKRKWKDRIRLAYVADRMCDECGGPLIKASWTATKAVACLACEHQREPVVALPAPLLPARQAPPTPRAAWEEPQFQPQEIILHSPARHWIDRFRRECARFLQRFLRGVSQTTIERELYRRHPNEVLQLYGCKPPIPQIMLGIWESSYIKLHPP